MNQNIMHKIYRRGFDCGRKAAEGVQVNFSVSLSSILRVDSCSIFDKFNEFCSGVAVGVQTAELREFICEADSAAGLTYAEREDALEAAIVEAEKRCTDEENGTLADDSR